jgi:hypothetical protein
MSRHVFTIISTVMAEWSPMKNVWLSICIAGALFFAPPSAPTQQTPIASRSLAPVDVGPTGIGIKRPVFAGACKACPWGVLAAITKAAMKPYGYDVQICWVCWSSYGPREVADKTKPVMPRGENVPWYLEPPPDGVPDFGITSDMNLTDAYLGRGAYANDHKQRQNYRVVATVLQQNYLLTAVSAKSGIKSLWDIKDRKEPTRIWVDNTNAATQTVLKYYGIDEQELERKGGGFIHPLMLERHERASAAYTSVPGCW